MSMYDIFMEEVNEELNNGIIDYYEAEKLSKEIYEMFRDNLYFEDGKDNVNDDVKERTKRQNTYNKFKREIAYDEFKSRKNKDKNRYSVDKFLAKRELEKKKEIDIATSKNSVDGENAWDRFLKRHKYDPKTKTIEMNGGRVRIAEVDSEAYMDGMPATTVITGRRDPAQYKDALSIDKVGNLKAKGIKVNPSKTKKMKDDDLEFMMQHEYGHIKDASYARRANRAISFDDKTSNKDVPKEFRTEYLSLRKQLKEYEKNGENPPKDFVKKFNNLFDKINTELRNSDKYKNDKEAVFKDKYDKMDEEVKKQIKKHTKLFNYHDKLPSEYKADLYARHHTEKNDENAKTKNIVKKTASAMRKGVDEHGLLYDNLDDDTKYKLGKNKLKALGSVTNALSKAAKPVEKYWDRHRNKANNELDKNTKGYVQSYMDESTMYDLIYSMICERVEEGYLTIEQADELNDLAYDKYVAVRSRIN